MSTFQFELRPKYEGAVSLIRVRRVDRHIILTAGNGVGVVTAILSASECRELAEALQAEYKRIRTAQEDTE